MPDGQREITYAEAVREAMSQAMRDDPTIFLMGEDVGVYGDIGIQCAGGASGCDAGRRSCRGE